jgi:hypothetical protein
MLLVHELCSSDLDMCITTFSRIDQKKILAGTGLSKHLLAQILIGSNTLQYSFSLVLRVHGDRCKENREVFFRGKGSDIVKWFIEMNYFK